MTNGRSIAWVIGAVTAASMIGFAAGLLIAPASGRETRRRLARRLEDETDDIRRKGQRAVVGVKDYVQAQVG